MLTDDTLQQGVADGLHDEAACYSPHATARSDCALCLPHDVMASLLPRLPGARNTGSASVARYGESDGSKPHGGMRHRGKYHWHANANIEVERDCRCYRAAADRERKVAGEALLTRRLATGPPGTARR